MKFSRIAGLCTVATLVAVGCGGDDSTNTGSGDKIVDASRVDAKKADAAAKDAGAKADATTVGDDTDAEADADTEGGEDASDASDDADAEDADAAEDDAEAGDIDAGVDTGAPDTGAPDTGAPDTGAPDTGAPDTGAPDTGPADTGAPDTGPADTGTPDTGPADTGAPDTGPADTGAPDATAANDYAAAKTLVGLYAERARFRTLEKTNAYNGNAEYKVLTATFLLATIADDPANQRVTLTEQPCHVAITTNNANIAETILDRVPTSTLPFTTPLVVHAAGGGVINWSRAGISAPVGFHDTTPGGALPTSVSDSRVFDQDNDGHPGATLSVVVTVFLPFAGDAYYVQRYQDRLAGTVQGGALTGTNVDTSTRVFLDSNAQGLKSSEISSRADSDTASNDVKFVTVPTGTTCSSVASAAF